MAIAPAELCQRHIDAPKLAQVLLVAIMLLVFEFVHSRVKFEVPRGKLTTQPPAKRRYRAERRGKFQ